LNSEAIVPASPLDLALVLGDLSLDSFKVAKAAQHAEDAVDIISKSPSPAAENTSTSNVEFSSDVRLFGFDEGYVCGEASGRDRIIYRARQGVPVQANGYHVFGGEQEDMVRAFSQGRSRPIAQMLELAAP